MHTFFKIKFSILHIGILFIIIVFLLISGIYVLYMQKWKKKYSRKSLIIAVSLGVILANIARRSVKNMIPEGQEGVIITVILLILAFFELLCTLVELSRYYVACKYNIELGK